MQLKKPIVIPKGAKLMEAPNQIDLYGKWYSYTIEIDEDHTAEMLIDDEALEVLNSSV